MSFLLAHSFVFLQYLLPKHLLTSLIFRLSRIRTVKVKDLLIRRFMKIYEIDISETGKSAPTDFASFNDFFTRELADGTRPIDLDESSVVSPVDGTLSAAGVIDRRQILQAKGKHYSLHDLLATNLQEADKFIDGSFATIYLAPYNYHRVHAPLAGELTSLRYVPGDLFSVNAVSVSLLPQLFCRNERLICYFETKAGAMAVIFVGALHVGSITTPWTGEIRPAKKGVGEELRLPDSAMRRVAKGDLLGWFNMGSTVITLLGPGAVEWNSGLETGSNCRVGVALGELKGTR